MIRQACNLCGSTDYSVYLSNVYNRYNLKICNSCGIVSTENIPLLEEIERYYQEEFYTVNNSSRFNVVLEKAVYFFRWLRAFNINNNFRGKRILDIGCGRGLMLYLLKKRGWEAYGTQISRPAAQYAIDKLGLNIFVGDLLKAPYPNNYFDVISIWHVLEHLPNPSEYLSFCNRLLKKGGILIVELPNIGSLTAKICKKRWFVFNPSHHHVYHFNPKTLEAILSKNGFVVYRKRFFSLEYNIFTMMQSFLNLIFSNDNNFYESLMVTEGKLTKKKTFLYKFKNFYLAALLFFPCVFISFLLFFFKSSDTMLFHCKKKND